jgi:hypothetical protein
MPNIGTAAGLSVSVESSPRSTSAVADIGAIGAPLKTRNSIRGAQAATEPAEICDDPNQESVSLSPRPIVARRLEFSSFEELSPVPATNSSDTWGGMATRTSMSAMVPNVGDCAICYTPLPARLNHVFTPCGHLFCVKCLLSWWELSTTCPMCRGEIATFDAENVAENSRDAHDAHDAHDADGWIQAPANAIEISSMDRYVNADTGIGWSIMEPSPDSDDMVFILSNQECANLRRNREIASRLWARKRFREALFSNTDVLCETFHTFIQRRTWLGFRMFDLGPHRMFEFVMCGTTAYNAPVETNFFGYISQIVIIEVEDPVYAASEDWEIRHEYAFVVHVFSPAASLGSYDIDDGSFDPVELIFRFSDIRRMYAINASERIST